MFRSFIPHSVSRTRYSKHTLVRSQLQNFKAETSNTTLSARLLFRHSSSLSPFVNQQYRCFSQQANDDSLYRSPLRADNEIQDQNAPLISSSLILDPIGSATGTVIWLHGMGEKIQQIKHMFTMIKPKSVKFVVPRAPVLPLSFLDDEELPAWFDVKTDQFNEQMEEDYYTIEQMRIRIWELLDNEINKVGSDRVILAGFAQGAAMALQAGLRYPHRLAGIVSLSGYVPVPSSLTSQISPANASTPILAVHGRQNRAIPHSFAAGRYELLKQQGVPVSFRLDPTMQHDITSTVLMQTQDWIIQTLNKANQRRKEAEQKPS